MKLSLPTRKHPCGGVGSFFLFLLIAIAVAAASWGLLILLVPKPNKVSKKSAQSSQNQALAEDENLRRKKANDARNEAQRQQTEKREQQRNERIQAEKIKAEAQRKSRIKKNLGICKHAIARKQWQKAQKFIGLLEDDQFDLVQTAKLLDSVEKGQSNERKALRKVNELIAKARTLDNGKYSAAALGYLSQARIIIPEHPEVIALYKKMNAYVNEIRVPQDRATIAEAIPLLRAGDTLILGEGKYIGPIVTPKPIVIKGAGMDKTTIECDTIKNSALHINGGKRAYEISNLTITATSYADDAASRNPLILVEGDLLLKNVLVRRSSGHGIAVISGTLTVENSTITENAWDGISLKGVDSSAVINNSKIISNYDHGIDFWQGASGVVMKSEIAKNTGSGIVVMGENASVELTQVTLKQNFQCGLVVADSASVKLQRVVSSYNTLSGIVVQGEATKADFGIVVSNKNHEVGYFIDPKSTIIGFENATAEGNKKGNTLRQSPTPPAELKKDSYVKPADTEKKKGEKDDEKPPVKKIPKAIIVE